jgi:Collagen triple helix repeat (20 copies)
MYKVALTAGALALTLVLVTGATGTSPVQAPPFPTKPKPPPPPAKKPPFTKTTTSGTKSLRGPRGPAGPRGPRGHAGARGATGARGAAGLKGDIGTAGATGATGATGAAGATGATGATGAAGAKGDKGDRGDSALDPVPSGRTIRGAVGGDFHAFDGSASDFGIDVTFPIPAPVGVDDNHVSVDDDHWQGTDGQTPPTSSDDKLECGGTPEEPTAPAGEVCIYVSGADHAFNLAGYSVLFGTGASKYGFKLKWDASQAGDTFVDATWAYTAP